MCPPETGSNETDVTTCLNRVLVKSGLENGTHKGPSLNHLIISTDDLHLKHLQSCISVTSVEVATGKSTRLRSSKGSALDLFSTNNDIKTLVPIFAHGKLAQCEGGVYGVVPVSSLLLSHA